MAKELPKFKNHEEEVRFWKNKANPNRRKNANNR